MGGGVGRYSVVRNKIPGLYGFVVLDLVAILADVEEFILIFLSQPKSDCIYQFPVDFE